MNYQSKYTNKSRAIKRQRRCTPELWVSGPDPITHDKYYAWLKHKAQARFRGEAHDLSWEDWLSFWGDNKIWFQRGRTADSLVLVMLDPEQGWTVNNVEVMNRKEYLTITKSKKS